MVKRILKPVILCVLAVLFALTCCMFVSGCTIETKHPEVKITVTFNGEDYVMKYKLYRNMYPQTVRHFIELASSGFYDNTIIHDYVDSDSWIGGGYSYNATDEEGNLISESYEDAIANDRIADYLELNDKEAEYNALYESGALTASVYSAKDDIKYNSKGAEDALRSVMGEFSNNIGQEIENGALSASYGTLKMFYYPLETMQHVFVTPNKKQVIEALYKYNSATSLFMIQTSSTSTYSASNYATFGKIKDSDDLDDLLDAVSDYIDDQEYADGVEFYVESDTVEVNSLESYSKEETDVGIQTTFNVTREPIIIKSIKVTKY
ncbi:MAG: peptidylprolyl isomerase [Clostridia bacterium]|nr:peptidylprolyl isomerase [Clostridia bacterium]